LQTMSVPSACNGWWPWCRSNERYQELRITGTHYYYYYYFIYVEVLRCKVVAKPFVSVYPPELPARRSLSFNKAESLRVAQTCEDMLTPRAEKIIGHPECADLVMDLYPGEYFPSPPNTYYPPNSINSPLVLPPCMDGDLDITHIHPCHHWFQWLYDQPNP
jgi:hypothetical protein